MHQAMAVTVAMEMSPSIAVILLLAAISEVVKLARAKMILVAKIITALTVAAPSTSLGQIPRTGFAPTTTMAPSRSRKISMDLTKEKLIITLFYKMQLSGMPATLISSISALCLKV